MQNTTKLKYYNATDKNNYITFGNTRDDNGESNKKFGNLLHQDVANERKTFLQKISDIS